LSSVEEEEENANLVGPALVELRRKKKKKEVGKRRCASAKKHMWAGAKTTKCCLAFLFLIDESYNYSGHRDE